MSDGCVLCGGELCDWDNQLFSWGEFTYRYQRCATCRSLVCEPMPDAALLAQLYGVDYAAASPGHYQVDPPRNVDWVKDHLTSRPPGTILDFGCGDGSLLRMAVNAGWKALGVELDPAVAARVSEGTGCPVLCSSDLSGCHPADVVNLGDVLEHVPEPAGVLAQALGLLASHGSLLVQGPLEAGPSLFSAVVRPGRRRRAGPVEVPPWHLIQATVGGQQELFRRCGLVEDSYDILQVDWPAPSRLTARDLRDPRSVALFALRRVSRLVDGWASTPASGASRGNRFRYVGSLP